ncbi:phosphoenolpyruvate synthase [Arthrobacter psychrochitiniphilus]|uniref:Phosphoenolpyruvate synthase n=1 Tax=Arthrobacter psychrochitiniphilus TaxID=291045 RepID=A0A2V3DTP5_9MICC|nr:phosphoenolpyruvate synthase [Arthrobacter psychrochitiniphilus]
MPHGAEQRRCEGNLITVDKESVVWLEDVGIKDVAYVGGKNASLGEMIRSLAADGVRVPGGFALTAAAYRTYIAENDMAPRLEQILATKDSAGTNWRSIGNQVRELILAGEFPPETTTQIRSFYRELAVRTGHEDPAVAVRSSATAEDLPDASFAGQQETFLNVRGEEQLLDACRRCYASLFTDRAISYREIMKYGHLDVALSVGVQLMVRSDLGAAGVMFSLDTESGFPRAAVLSANWGLGETVVLGMVNPDKYVVFKPLLGMPAFSPVIEKLLGSKGCKLVYSSDGGAGTRMVDTTDAERTSFCLNDDEILQLGRWAVQVENHYGRPMDMEWAKDGMSGELFIVQARPETVQARKSGTVMSTHRLTEEGRLLVEGAAVGDSIASGIACVIKSAADIGNFVDGAVLVAEQTDPDWVPVMKRAKAIVTDKGGATSHAAIVSRELGITAVVGTTDATKVVVDGQSITVSCADGDTGHVYEGLLASAQDDVDLGELPVTRTSVMLNLASPSSAFKWWRLPAKGIGLARMEFVINDMVQVHPMALAYPERVTDPADRAKIKELTRGFADSSDYFVQTLARGLAKLAAPFHPAPVVVRFSDFKTNEYAHLIGGSVFEGEESNPMIGFRGASRYYDPHYRAGFDLECRAILRLRNQCGFMNVIVMVPFCRTLAEADRVLAVMAENGLVRGQDGLKVYMMCEIPSNVILAPKFAAKFDGFSIGSNDLTQLVLGVDRDSAILAPLFDEQDEAVKTMISQAIAGAHAAGIRIGICGQAPSNHPEFAQFVVAEGIDSISLNPDSFLRTVPVIAAAEAAQKQNPIAAAKSSRF